jgi:NACHT domain
LKTNISPQSYEHKLDWLHTRVCQGTGRWLLKDSTFARWLDITDASVKVLWLQGIPGAGALIKFTRALALLLFAMADVETDQTIGKTFLSSTIIHKTREFKQTRTIYVFLSYTFGGSLSALSIFHSMIFHLAEGHDDLQDVLCQSNSESLKSSIEAAASLLKTLLACAGPTYILIDGLDEIGELERYGILKRLLDLSKTCQEAKILISSRAEADITDLLKDQVSIRVDSQNRGSIQTFVNRRTEEWFRKCSFLPEAQIEIQGLLAPLASNANGMYTLAPN